MSGELEATEPETKQLRGPALPQPVDSDIDVHLPAQRAELRRSRGRILVVVALGGGIGALARYGISLLLPTTPGHFPLGTFLINVLGCALIGVLMVLVSEVYPNSPLPRPFFGTGVLGGFTTFSTYTNEFRGLLKPDTVLLAFGYLAGTLVAALLAVSLATWATRRIVGSAREVAR